MINRHFCDRKVCAEFAAALFAVPAFAQVPIKSQLPLAHMILNDSLVARAHHSIPGTTSHSHQQLTHIFGRSQFQRVNNIARAFELGPWSVERGHTRTFKLLPPYAGLRSKFLRRIVLERQSCHFVDLRGRHVKAIRKAIGSKRRNGATATFWKNVEISALVPVDTVGLTRLYENTDSALRIRQREYDGGELILQSDTDPLLNTLFRRRESVAMLLLAAYSDLGGGDAVPVRYVEAMSGRLYAADFNLQNCVRDVRFAAMAGCYDVDLENAHYGLLAYLAEGYNFSCPAIRHYLGHKKAIRNTLAANVGANVDAIKQCLIALIYDAALSISEKAAFGKALGQEGARRLLNQQFFRELADEVKQAGRHVVTHWPIKSQRLINHCQYGIMASEMHNKKLAHILHGAEASILRAAVTYVEATQSGNVLLLQHDGFSVKQAINVEELNAHIRSVTGFDVPFAIEQIGPPLS